MYWMQMTGNCFFRKNFMASLMCSIALSREAVVAGLILKYSFCTSITSNAGFIFPPVLDNSLGYVLRRIPIAQGQISCPLNWLISKRRSTPRRASSSGWMRIPETRQVFPVPLLRMSLEKA
jgi:hypothetical protein